MLGGGGLQALVVGLVVLVVDRLDDQRASRAGLERAAERLDDRERVLALEHALVVEGEQEHEARGQAQRRAIGRRRVLDEHRLGDVDDRDRRHPRERVGDVSRARPDLVDVAEGRQPALREGRHLPPPQPDRVAAGEEARAGVVGERRQGVGVDADEVRREAPRAAARGGGAVGGKARVLQAVRSDEVLHRHARADRLERPRDLARRLADAEHRAEVAGDVDAQCCRIVGGWRVEHLRARDERARHLAAADRLRPRDEPGAVLAADVGKRHAQVRARLLQRHEVAVGRLRPSGGAGQPAQQLPRARLRERAGRHVAGLERAAVAEADRGVDPRPVGKAVVPVGPRRPAGVGVLEQALGVALADLAQRRAVTELDAVLVLAEQVRLGGVEAAEVKEAQRPAVDGPAVVSALDLARGEVPVGDVVAGVAQDMKARHEARGEVHPALVDEEAALRRDDAVGGQPLAPPVQQLVGVRARRQADEAEVVGARDEDVGLAGLQPVARHRRGEVRRDDEAMLVQQRLELAEAAVDLDVGVEVGERRRAAHVEQVAQQPGLDRRRQLEHVVQRSHAVEVLDVQVGGREDLKRLRRRVQVAVVVVDDEHEAAPVWVVLGERLGQHAGERRVVGGDDRADVHGDG